ncbi:unnamed protein product [Amoebophrya sp. A120]|nr:unnamed protein product [Amoebophrya sp. A120]|eukprot:GSA120T00016680001.1
MPADTEAPTKENPYNGVWIELERCFDCHTHEYCTRHDEKKYDHYEKQISESLDGKVPAGMPYKFVKNPGPKSHGVNCKRSEYNPFLYAAYSLNENTGKWYQTQVFRYPRIGAFEIFVNKGKNRREVFSKLKKGKWPNPDFAVDKILETVEQMGGWHPVAEVPKPKKKYKGIGGKMSITDEELRALMKKKFATLMTAFKSFDKNGDGQVNRKEFGVGLKHVGVDLPPAIVDRIWKMADTDGTGALAYQEFARKFAAYKATASLHRDVAFKTKEDELAEKLHGSGAGRRQTKHSVSRTQTQLNFEMDKDEFNENQDEPDEMTVPMIARGGDLSSRDIETMTGDEIRALCLQKHGNLLVAFRQMAVNSSDFKVSYGDFMERFPSLVGKQVSALKMNQLWQTMDADMSGFIDMKEWASNQCLDKTSQTVLIMKDQIGKIIEFAEEEGWVRVKFGTCVRNYRAGFAKKVGLGRRYVCWQKFSAVAVKLELQVF